MSQPNLPNRPEKGEQGIWIQLAHASSLDFAHCCPTGGSNLGSADFRPSWPRCILGRAITNERHGERGGSILGLLFSQYPQDATEEGKILLELQSSPLLPYSETPPAFRNCRNHWRLPPLYMPPACRHLSNRRRKSPSYPPPACRYLLETWPRVPGTLNLVVKP